MTEDRYLIDNNVLARLSPTQLSSRLFRDCCRLPSEVIYEARHRLPPGGFREVEEPVTPQVLRMVSHVMSNVPVGDTSLVDLYANRGNADPLLLAHALVASQEASDTLFPSTWIVVSDDRAVQKAAGLYGLSTETSDEFLRRFDVRGES